MFFITLTFPLLQFSFPTQRCPQLTVSVLWAYRNNTSVLCILRALLYNNFGTRVRIDMNVKILSVDNKISMLFCD